jgi:hypothetical protein
VTDEARQCRCRSGRAGRCRPVRGAVGCGPQTGRRPSPRRRRITERSPSLCRLGDPPGSPAERAIDRRDHRPMMAASARLPGREEAIPHGRPALRCLRPLVVRRGAPTRCPGGHLGSGACCEGGFEACGGTCVEIVTDPAKQSRHCDGEGGADFFRRIRRHDSRRKRRWMESGSIASLGCSPTA